MWYLLITNKISEDLRRSYVLILSIWYYTFYITEKLPKMTDETSEQMTDKKDPKMSEDPTDEDLDKFGISDERHWIQINCYVTYIT